MGDDLIQALGSELGWDGAELWRMAGDERLRRTAPWTASGVRLDRFMRPAPGSATRSATASRAGVDVACAAVEVRRQRRHRGRGGLADGIRSAVALPLRAAGVPAGVVVLVSRTPREPEPGLVRLLEAIGGQVTQFLQRREAEGRAAEQAEDLRKLSAIAHQLAAQSDHTALA